MTDFATQVHTSYFVEPMPGWTDAQYRGAQEPSTYPAILDWANTLQTWASQDGRRWVATKLFFDGRCCVADVVYYGAIDASDHGELARARERRDREAEALTPELPDDRGADPGPSGAVVR